jgi:hypothetical protein
MKSVHGGDGVGFSDEERTTEAELQHGLANTQRLLWKN